MQPELKKKVGKPKGKKALENPSRRWENNTKMNLKYMVSIRGNGLILFRTGVIGEPL